MRAIIVDRPAERGNIRVGERPEPIAGPGDVLVDVAYAGCNYADTKIARGTYVHPKGYPIVAGLELSGRAVAVGPGVTHVAVGDLVAGMVEDGGAFAERCLVRADRILKLPAGMGLDVAAAIPIQAFTAWHMLHNVGRTRADDVLLVHAIGGGVGLHLTQLAVRAGATVIGTVGTRGKEALPLALGASRVIHRDDEDFVAAALAATDGRGVDAVLDSTGGTILDRSFEAVRRLGRVVSIGEAEGRPLPSLWERLVPRSLTFTRMHLGHVDFAGEAWRRSVDEIVGAVLDGSLKAPIAEVFAFERADEMLTRLRSRQVSGKLLLSVSPAPS